MSLENSNRGVRPGERDGGAAQGAASREAAEANGTDGAETPQPSSRERLEEGIENAFAFSRVLRERTVSVEAELDEDAFFRDEGGRTTIANRYDLEKAVSFEKKTHFREVDRYWVNEPYAFVVVFHSIKENERKYYVIEPHLTPVERSLIEFLTKKLRETIKYSKQSEIAEEVDESAIEDGGDVRAVVIERETERLLQRYGLYEGSIVPAESNGLLARLRGVLGRGRNREDAPEEGSEDASQEGRPTEDAEEKNGSRAITVSPARPEPAILEEDARKLTGQQVEKILYRLKRDFLGYGRIDGIKHDINVEDISCDGYNSPVFVYHSEHEQIISNIAHGEDELDEFVVKLAQRSGKGISKRQPQVDATLDDGSRAQLTLGREVSGHGTNYTIRQFKDVPYTPVDLVNWNTFSLEEMAYLWLCIENNRSILFAGGTASGKTTSLNAVSLFIPSKAKIVSIEDTREVELPQRNWIASITRDSFTDDAKGEVDHFDLLAAALRQRPEYIVMGEIRGEEGRTLFQVMSTGHTGLTTFHADTVGEVIKRFTTAPINVSKTMFTALDLVSIQTSTRVGGKRVRRSRSITELNYYDSENDEINVRDLFQWEASSDEFLRMGNSATLDQIRFDNGWTRERVDAELFERKLVLAYLIDRGLNTYTDVAATLQAYIMDPETILTLIARDELPARLDDLRTMESVKIDTDPEKEAMVPRPDPSAELEELTDSILEEAEELLAEHRDEPAMGLDTVLRAGGIDGTDETERVEAVDRGDGLDGLDESDGDGGDGKNGGERVDVASPIDAEESDPEPESDLDPDCSAGEPEEP